MILNLLDNGVAIAGRGRVDHPFDVRCEHWLEDAPGYAGGERGQGLGCLHRAAVFDVRGVSVRPASLSAALHIGRVHGRHRYSYLRLRFKDCSYSKCNNDV